MRYGIFSDIHSNLEAFRVVTDFYKEQAIDRYIFLGDAVGYGANPHESIDLLKTLPDCTSIAGNHDWGVVNKLSIEYFNPYAKEAILWTKKHLRPGDTRFLTGLPLIHEEPEFTCVHGSLQSPEAFHYILNEEDAVSNFPSLQKKLLFIGHSHRREVFIEKGGELRYSKNDEILLEQDARYIVNVGSVGQPRDSDRRAACCIYDSRKQSITFRRLDYDVDTAAQKITKAGLPTVLGARLFLGK